MRTCFLTIDVEKREDDKSFEGVEKLDDILNVFKKHKVNATLFVTGEVLKKYPDLAKKWSQDFEIGCHNYYHNTLNTLNLGAREQQISDFIELYQGLFGARSRGFRAPRNIINNEQFSILEKYGFLYDASVFPRYPWRLKRYEGYKGKAPVSPYWISKKIFEIPESPVGFSIPLVGTWLRKLGIVFYKFLFILRKPEFISFSMHSWDGVEFKGGKNSGKKYLNQLDRMLGYLNQIGYNFKTGERIYEEFSKNH